MDVNVGVGVGVSVAAVVGVDVLSQGVSVGDSLGASLVVGSPSLTSLDY